MIFLKSANLSLGSKLILSDVSHTFAQNAKVGLVGRNGAGKSTLLRVIAGQQSLDAGIVRIAGGKRIAYVPQNETFSSDLTVLEQVKTAFADFFILYKQQQLIEHKIAQATVTPDELEQYANVCIELQDFDAGAIERQALAVLTGLGFSPERMHMRVDHLSVGWAMRVYLAQMLLSNADFYLFDEPTNHLDIVCRGWFVSYLKHAPFGFILVSHDRSVINNACEQICEVDRGQLTFYRGNYDAYERQKAERLELLRLAKNAQDKEIIRKKGTIARFRASATKAKMVQGLIRELAAIEPIIIPSDPSAAHFSFPTPPKIAKDVLSIADVAYSYGDTQVLEHVSFRVERGWRVALVAPNGVGKSTLLRLIVKKLPLQTGHITIAESARIGYFDQEQAKALDGSKSVLKNVLSATSVGEQAVRNTLGCFLFSGDDVNKPVDVLSGGEKNRVGMAQVLLQGANFLILDEPTNHLDLISKEILLKALNASHCTMLFVSHDAGFIDGLATHVVDLTHHGAQLFHGNYNDLLVHKRIMGMPEADALVTQGLKKQKKAIPIDSSAVHKREKELQKLEHRIKLLEKKIQQKEHVLAKLEYGTEQFTKRTDELQALHEELETVSKKWELVLELFEKDENRL